MEIKDCSLRKERRQMVESLQHKLDRVRPPRVQITYDVEVGNAIVMKELPFVVGVLSDLSGHPSTTLPRLKERKFVEIDRDNIEHVMQSIEPRLALRVGNKVNPAQDHMSLEVTFKSMSDFEPLNIIRQVPDLSKLYQSRIRLKDLMTKIDGNDHLDEMLREIIMNPGKKEALKRELGLSERSPSPTSLNIPEA